MQPPARLRSAPLLDAACIVTFVLIGRGRHDIDEGIGWFFTVLWPLFAGWYGVALLVKLYTRTAGIWGALAITWIGGLAVMSVLRGAFTDRPYGGIFTVVAVGYIGLTAFGWRAAAALITRRRAAASAS
jgi:hypothetical protein